MYARQTKQGQRLNIHETWRNMPDIYFYRNFSFYR